MYSLCYGLAGLMLRKIKCQPRDMKRSRYVEHGWELVNIVLPGVLPTQAVFQIRDGFRVKNPTTSTTWTGTDENDSRLRYFYKLKYYTLSDPLRNCMTPCRKTLTGTLIKEATLLLSNCVLPALSCKFVPRVLLCYELWSCKWKCQVVVCLFFLKMTQSVTGLIDLGCAFVNISVLDLFIIQRQEGRSKRETTFVL